MSYNYKENLELGEEVTNLVVKEEVTNLVIEQCPNLVEEVAEIPKCYYNYAEFIALKEEDYDMIRNGC